MRAWRRLACAAGLPVVAGCAIIVLGTALATGALKWPRRTHPAA